MPIDKLISMYQLPKTKDEPVNVVAAEHDLNPDFEKTILQHEGIIMRYMRNQERNTCRNHPKLHTQVDSKKFSTKAFT